MADSYRLPDGDNGRPLASWPDKYGDSPNAPTWEFTITLHAAMLVAAAIIIVFYKKRIKRKLMEYGKD